MTFVILILILVVSVIVHEVAHGYMAYALGDPTAKLAGRLTLNPLAHLDPFGSVILPLLLALSGSGFIIGWAKPVPYNPDNLRSARWGSLWVGAAGPLTNLFLAVVFSVVARLALSPAPEVAALAGVVVIINLVLAVFNLIPVPPLDGSKILFALLPYRFRHLEHSLGLYWLLVILFVFFFLWQYVSVVVIALAALLAGPAPILAALGQFL